MWGDHHPLRCSPSTFLHGRALPELFHEWWQKVGFLIHQLGPFSEGRPFSHDRPGALCYLKHLWVVRSAGRTFQAHWKEGAFCRGCVERSMDVSDVHAADGVAVFQPFVSLLICAPVPSKTKTRSAESPVTTVGLSISPFISISVCVAYL